MMAHTVTRRLWRTKHTDNA